MTVSIDYIPKNKLEKIATYAKEQLDILKHGATQLFSAEMPSTPQSEEYIEVETEEVVNFAEIMPMTTPEYTDHQLDSTNSSEVLKEKVSQVYLKMNCSRITKQEALDNGLILQGEYDAYKKEILSHM
jgi:hypothetical protein